MPKLSLLTYLALGLGCNAAILNSLIHAQPCLFRKQINSCLKKHARHARLRTEFYDPEGTSVFSSPHYWSFRSTSGIVEIRLQGYRISAVLRKRNGGWKPLAELGRTTRTIENREVFSLDKWIAGVKAAMVLWSE